jgi:hypothetical protein
MGLKEIARGIKEFVGTRPAYAEVCIGPSLNTTIRVSDRIASFNIGSVGNLQNIDFGIRIVNAIGIRTDDRFRKHAVDQGHKFNEATLNVFADFTQSEFTLASQGRSKLINDYRDLLGLYVGGSLRPIVRINWSSAQRNGCEFLAPSYFRGLPRNTLDPINLEFLTLCATERAGDERLHRYVRMYNRNTVTDGELLKIARMFSLLEYMAAPIAVHFRKKSGSAKIGSRATIRFMREYFETIDVPKFTLYRGGVPTDFGF